MSNEYANEYAKRVFFTELAYYNMHIIVLTALICAPWHKNLCLPPCHTISSSPKEQFWLGVVMNGGGARSE